MKTVHEAGGGPGTPSMERLYSSLVITSCAINYTALTHSPFRFYLATVIFHSKAIQLINEVVFLHRTENLGALGDKCCVSKQ